MSSLHLKAVVLPETEPRDLWVADGVVVEGPIAGAETLATGVWVLPGLVDAHCHLGLEADGAGGARGASYEVALDQATTDRNAGTLLIRDAGTPGDTWWVDDRADLPKVVRAGRHIARTRRYVKGLGVEIEPEQLVDEVAAQCARGTGWVKIVGDWIDRSVGDLAPCWPADVAAEAIAKAHELGCRVTAHTFAEQAVAELVAAGIDCIEHGTGASAEVIEQMAAQGTALVPTMTNLANFPHYADQGEPRFPTYAAHMRALHAKRHATLGAAREAGVAIYCGTDAGTFVKHGLAKHEVTLLGEIGSPEFALGAATWRARPWLGASNLEVGASADFVVYTADPRADLQSVVHPKHVVLRGEVVHSA
jgi:imidazolonepropionase-like amidohydrolase